MVQIKDLLPAEAASAGAPFNGPHMDNSADWTSGYVVEVDYTHGYYRELSPVLIDFTLLVAGFEPPARGSGRYLELGMGQGLSANIHAAAVEGECVGVDFNPSHAANAMQLAQASGSGARFFDDSFAQFAGRDMGEFDYITLHGVWSWVSEENRDVLVDIIRRKVKVGGAVYISYNSLPGWASAMPLRHLLTLHGKLGRAGADGIVSSIDHAIEFGRKVAEVGARYYAATPGAKDRLDAIADQNRRYLAHEYFNLDWLPMYFSEINQRLSSAKLHFTASANLLDHVPGINTTAEQSALLAGVAHPVLRETVRDYILNQQFRKDLFTRGARRLADLDRQERLNDALVALTTPAADIAFDITAGLGALTLKQDIYGPLIESLSARDYAPKRLGDLAEDPSLKRIGGASLLEAVTVLVGAGHAHPAQSGAAVEKATPACARLNEHLVRRARVSEDVGFLASPVIGGGLQVSRFEQLFLLSRLGGADKPEQWAQFAWDVLQRQNQVLIKDGKPLAAPQDNLDELTRQATALEQRRLPLLRALRVA